MKKNKGFTLIELLAVIVILAIIVSFSTINIVKIYKKQAKNNEVSVANAIFTGVRKYVADHPEKLYGSSLDTPHPIIASSNIETELINKNYVDFDTNKYPDFKNATIKAEFCDTASGDYRVTYFIFKNGASKWYNDCGCVKQNTDSLSNGLLICDDKYSGYDKDGNHYFSTDSGSSWTSDSLNLYN